MFPTFLAGLLVHACCFVFGSGVRISATTSRIRVIYRLALVVGIWEITRSLRWGGLFARARINIAPRLAAPRGRRCSLAFWVIAFLPCLACGAGVCRKIGFLAFNVDLYVSRLWPNTDTTAILVSPLGRIDLSSTCLLDFFKSSSVALLLCVAVHSIACCIREVNWLTLVLGAWKVVGGFWENSDVLAIARVNVAPLGLAPRFAFSFALWVVFLIPSIAPCTKIFGVLCL